MLRTSLLFLLAAVATYAFYQPQPLTTIQICGDLGDHAEGALRAAGVGLSEDGALLTLEIANREAAVGALCTVHETLDTAKHVLESNIANAGTTMTADGLPYRRQYLRISTAGEALGVEHDGSDFRWVYDPQHPQAVKEGEKTGYLAMPNVDVQWERASLALLDCQQMAIRMVLQRLDPDLLISPLRSNRWSPAPGDAGATARALTRSDASHLSATDKLNLMTLQLIPPPEMGEDPVAFDPRWAAGSASLTQIGQAAVASSLNWLFREPRFQANTIDARHGFELLSALKQESRVLGLDWCDAGNLNAELWPALEHHLAAGRPAILALGDDSWGQIVMLTKIEGDLVTYLDPSTSRERTTDRTSLLHAPQHPDGNFVFLTCALVPASLR